MVEWPFVSRQEYQRALAERNEADRCFVLAKARLSKMEKDYHELLFAVVNKHEGETRHETALRYITEHENGPAKEALAGERDD